MKDVSWLWRVSYNYAVQGCSEWEGCEEQIAELFDISREVSAIAGDKTELMDNYEHLATGSLL